MRVIDNSNEKLNLIEKQFILLKDISQMSKPNLDSTKILLKRIKVVQEEYDSIMKEIPLLEYGNSQIHRNDDLLTQFMEIIEQIETILTKGGKLKWNYITNLFQEISQVKRD